MSRARIGAWLALALVAGSLSTAPLCGSLICAARATDASCHPSGESLRFSDCCAAHSSSSATASEALLAALALPRLEADAAPLAFEPSRALDLVGEALAGRAVAVSLFTLHRSLLL